MLGRLAVWSVGYFSAYNFTVNGVHEVNLIIVRVSVQFASFICFSVIDQCLQVRGCDCVCRKIAEGSRLMRRKPTRKDRIRVLSRFSSTNHTNFLLLLLFQSVL